MVVAISACGLKRPRCGHIQKDVSHYNHYDSKFSQKFSVVNNKFRDYCSGMATPAEATEKPDGSQAAQPSTVTIPKGDPALPSDMEQWQIGDAVTLKGKISAIDDQGCTIQPESVEREATEAGPEGEPEGGEPTGASPQTDYVTKRRREMMAEPE
jgi:hypothetical protein